MSVRIHAIAKEINKTSKEVLEILSKRGYDLKSASSTIDNITAQSLIEEFSSPSGEENSAASAPEQTSASDKETPSDATSKKAPIVRTKADLDREKLEKEEAENAKKQKDLKAEASEVPEVVDGAKNLPEKKSPRWHLLRPPDGLQHHLLPRERVSLLFHLLLLLHHPKCRPKLMMTE